MPARLLALALSALVFTGCSDDAPAVDSTTTLTTDAATTLEAERDALVAELEAAEAQAEIDSLQSALDAARGRGSSASATPSSGGSSATPASSGSASAAPGLTGLPPSRNATELLTATRDFRFCETYTQSAVARYEGMQLCYEGTVRQEGSKLIGSGVKTDENSAALSGAARTPIRIEGYLYDDESLRFNYTVKGERRVTRGSTNFDGSQLQSGCEGHGWQTGTFQTDAANSSGTAFMFIEQNCGV